MDYSKLRDIKLLLLDVDGVLTNGDIIYNDANVQTKIFNVKDGLGIRLLQSNGIQVGIVTARSSNALLHRCRDLGIELIYEGVSKKNVALELACLSKGFSPAQVAYVGDDLPDIPLLNKVGVPIAVADAHEKVKEIVGMITKKKGGEGAVREVCESILKAKGLWENVVNQWE